MPKKRDLTGIRFGKLTVVSRVGNAFRWHCNCDCGGTVTAEGSNLRKGATKSCGCFRKEIGHIKNLTHGMTDTRAYGTWSNMKRRCHAPTHDKFKYYGGRGIKVCDRWLHSFENFMKDMGPCPAGGSIERKDSSGNYEPSNCEWATKVAQANNKSSNRLETVGGVTRTLAQWATISGVNYKALHARMSAGWTIEKALSVPVKTSKKLQTDIAAPENQSTARRRQSRPAF